MYEKFIQELDEMRERKASFTDYFHKMVEIVNNVEGNNRILLLYSVISDVRSIGEEKGKNIERVAMLDFLNNRQ